MVYFVLQLHYTVSSTCWSDIKEFEIAFWTSVSSKSLFVAELPFPLDAKHYKYILPHCSYSRLQIVVFLFPHPFTSSLVSVQPLRQGTSTETILHSDTAAAAFHATTCLKLK